MDRLPAADIVRLARDLARLGVKRFEGHGITLELRQQEPRKRRRKAPPQMQTEATEGQRGGVPMAGPYAELASQLWPAGMPRVTGDG